MHILVTGASSGIGYATAQNFARRGHRVTVAARRLERLETLALELRDVGRVRPVQVDLTCPEDRSRLVESARDAFGPVDVLVNNAGASRRGKWWDDPRAMDVLELNLVAAIDLTRLVLPEMLARRSGHIITVTSVAGHIATGNMYSTSKFGLRGFSLSLRRELLGTGVHASSIAPGFIRTEMTRGKNLPGMGSAEQVADAIYAVLKRPRAEVVVPGYYRAIMMLERWFPILGDRLIWRVMGGKS